MEWEAPAIVLQSRSYGEGGALVTVLTEGEGAFHALARGGTSRAQSALWQQGNLIKARWVARLSEQLGSISAELVHTAAAPILDDPLALCVLASACAVAHGALPEREPHPRIFNSLLQLIAALASTRAGAANADLLPDLIRWEADLLADLGYGLDLSACALTGATAGLAYVSPRTGRAVARDAAGPWADRLLPLPGFLAGANASTPADWRDGLLLTGHFLARDAFGHHHRPLPDPRLHLYDRVAALTPAPFPR